MNFSIAPWIKRVGWECRLAVATRSFTGALIVVIALSTIAFAIGYSRMYHRNRIQDTIRTESVEKRRFLESAYTDETDLERIAGRKLSSFEKSQATILRLVADNPMSLAYFGPSGLAIATIPALSSLSIGHSDLWPDRYRISAWSKLSMTNREDVSNPSILETTPYDLSSFVIVVLPLILIATSHDLISGDRELGVLPLSLSQPTRYSTTLLARSFVRVLVPVVLTISVTIFCVTLTQRDGFRNRDIVQLAAWAALALSYGGFWCSVSLAINSLGFSSASNAITMLLIWVATVVAIPSLATRDAESAMKSKSRDELVTMEREIDAAAQKNGDKLLDQFFADHQEITRPPKEKDPYGQNRWVAIGNEVDRQMTPIMERYRDDLEIRNRRLAQWYSLSPAIVVKTAMSELSGTSLRQFVEFARGVEKYHSEYMTYMRPLMMTREKMNRAEFDRIPLFDISKVNLSPDPVPVLSGIAIPGIWAILLGGIALKRLSHGIRVS